MGLTETQGSESVKAEMCIQVSAQGPVSESTPPSPSVSVNHGTVAGGVWPGCRWKPGAHLFHQKALQLSLTVLHALAVSAVYHPDEAIRALKVVPPVGAQGLLATHIPDVQLESGRKGQRRSGSCPPSLPPAQWPSVTPLTRGALGS